MIDPPGSLRTTARAINSSGDIVGFFSDSTGFHGFLVNKNNLTSFTTLDFLGATFTLATAINDSGQIVGIHGDSAFADHAFVRSPTGTFTGVADVQGAMDTDSWQSTTRAGSPAFTTSSDTPTGSCATAAPLHG